MRYRAILGGGFAAGYVLGARAGRQRYDSIVRAFRRLKDDPSVLSTAGVVQAHAAGALDSARRAVTETVANKVGGRDVTAQVVPVGAPVQPIPAPPNGSPPSR